MATTVTVPPAEPHDPRTFLEVSLATRRKTAPSLARVRRVRSWAFHNPDDLPAGRDRQPSENDGEIGQIRKRADGRGWEYAPVGLPFTGGFSRRRDAVLALHQATPPEGGGSLMDAHEHNCQAISRRGDCDQRGTEQVEGMDDVTRWFYAPHARMARFAWENDPEDGHR